MPTTEGLKEWHTWLIHALDYIDFCYEIFLSEVSILGYYTKGVFRYIDLCGMDFDLYNTLINPIIEQHKINISKENNQDG